MTRPPRGGRVLLLVLAAMFVWLGAWQIQRLAWKTRLIARTEAAMRAAPLDPAALPTGDLSGLTYRRLAMTGHFLPQATTLVTGTSVLGTGYWELVPLVGDRTVMVNRGFLPQGSTVATARRAVPAGTVRIIGLMRPTEPHGTWLRANRPADDRWYTRDIAAIAARRGVAADPRLFIDSITPATDGPVAGLTLVTFPNNHLGYALTWFTLALMAVGGAFVLNRRA